MCKKLKTRKLLIPPSRGSSDTAAWQCTQDLLPNRLRAELGAVQLCLAISLGYLFFVMHNVLVTPVVTSTPSPLSVNNKPPHHSCGKRHSWTKLCVLGPLMALRGRLSCPKGDAGRLCDFSNLWGQGFVPRFATTTLQECIFKITRKLYLVQDILDKIVTPV